MARWFNHFRFLFAPRHLTRCSTVVRSSHDLARSAPFPIYRRSRKNRLKNTESFGFGRFGSSFDVRSISWFSLWHAFCVCGRPAVRLDTMKKFNASYFFLRRWCYLWFTRWPIFRNNGQTVTTAFASLYRRLIRGTNTKNLSEFIYFFHFQLSFA